MAGRENWVLVYRTGSLGQGARSLRRRSGHDPEGEKRLAMFSFWTEAPEGLLMPRNMGDFSKRLL